MLCSQQHWNVHSEIVKNVAWSHDYDHGKLDQTFLGIGMTFQLIDVKILCWRCFEYI